MRADADLPGLWRERFAPAPGPAAFGRWKAPKSRRPSRSGSPVWHRGLHPLRLRNALTQEQAAEPVAYRVTPDLGAEFGVWRKRLALGLAPIALWQIGDRLHATGSPDPSADSDSTLCYPGSAISGCVAGALDPAGSRRCVGPGHGADDSGPGGAANFIATSGFAVARGWSAGFAKAGLPRPLTSSFGLLRSACSMARRRP